MNRRQIGTEYETLAAEYLKSQGYELVERNFRCRLGEIDIIAKDHSYLCFVEVKYRINEMHGTAVEAVVRRKQRIITKVAWYYLLTHGGNEWTPCRFDVIAIEGDKVTLYQNAFEAQI